jgi:hypothetical protein
MTLHFLFTFAGLLPRTCVRAGGDACGGAWRRGRIRMGGITDLHTDREHGTVAGAVDADLLGGAVFRRQTR